MIMDPHAINNPKDGLYIINLDGDGKCIQIEPHESSLASKSIFFYDKPWMAYIPKTN